MDKWAKMHWCVEPKLDAKKEKKMKVDSLTEVVFGSGTTNTLKYDYTPSLHCRH